MTGVLLIARMASDHLIATERMQPEVVDLLALIRLDQYELWDFEE